MTSSSLTLRRFKLYLWQMSIDFLIIGQGLAGSLLKSEPLDAEFKQLVEQLTTLSSNLNKFGLFYKPKPVKPNATVFPYPGKDPRR